MCRLSRILLNEPLYFRKIITKFSKKFLKQKCYLNFHRFDRYLLLFYTIITNLLENFSISIFTKNYLENKVAEYGPAT